MDQHGSSIEEQEKEKEEEKRKKPCFSLRLVSQSYSNYICGMTNVRAEDTMPRLEENETVQPKCRLMSA